MEYKQCNAYMHKGLTLRIIINKLIEVSVEFAISWEIRILTNTLTPQ